MSCCCVSEHCGTLLCSELVSGSGLVLNQMLCFMLRGRVLRPECQTDAVLHAAWPSAQA